MNFFFSFLTICYPPFLLQTKSVCSCATYCGQDSTFSGQRSLRAWGFMLVLGVSFQIHLRVGPLFCPFLLLLCWGPKKNIGVRGLRSAHFQKAFQTVAIRWVLVPSTAHFRWKFLNKEPSACRLKYDPSTRLNEFSPVNHSSNLSACTTGEVAKREPF